MDDNNTLPTFMSNDPDPSTSSSTAPTGDITQPDIIEPLITNTTKSDVGENKKIGKKFGGGKGKFIATILGILLLVGGVGAGVVLVRQNQDVREKAAGCGVCPEGEACITRDGISACEPTGGQEPCGNTICAVGYTCQSPGVCVPGGGGGHDYSWNCPPGTHLIYSNPPVYFTRPSGSLCHYKAACWPPQEAIIIGDWPLGDNPDDRNYGCAVGGSCSNAGQTYCQQCWCEADSTPAPPTATCYDIKAYDENWSQLTNSQLAQLQPGDVVRFSVIGQASSGSFTKARFTINGRQRAEVTVKKSGTQEFYDEYTIPTGVTSFSISAQVYHETLGWK